MIIIGEIKEVSWEDHGFKNNWCSSNNILIGAVWLQYLIQIAHDQKFSTLCYCLNIPSDAILHCFIALVILNQYLKDKIMRII